jgi:hypothetical protein
MTICFDSINWISVLVASLAAFAIGGLWYSPLLFSKIWQRELKLSDEDLKSANMALIFGTTFFLNVVGAVFLDMLIGPEACWMNGLVTGLLVGLAWISTSIGINYLFGRKSLKLFLIDAGYFVVFYAIMGLILGSL